MEMKFLGVLLGCTLFAWATTAQNSWPVRATERVAAYRAEQAIEYAFSPFRLSPQRSQRLTALDERGATYEWYQLDARALARAEQDAPEAMTLTLPSAGRSSLRLELVKASIFTEDFRVRTSSGATYEAAGIHYRGIVHDESNSFASLSMLNGELVGSVSVGDKIYSLAKWGVTNASTYIFYDESVLPAPDAVCETPDDQFIYDRAEITHFGRRARRSEPCVRIYLEADYNIYEHYGSVATASSYLIGLFNQMATLYANEQIKVVLSELFIWDTPDPYTSASASENLQDFRSTRQSFNGDLAGLLSFESSGGIAYVDALCNKRYAYSFSAINPTYENIPVYSWSINVIAHEFGHLLGSQHTHACVWNGNGTAIDGCYNVQGACSRPGIPENGGTIMSYCHLTGVGVNFANGFGEQPGNLMRNRVANNNCLTSCDPNQKADDSTAVAAPAVQFGRLTVDANWQRVEFGTTFDTLPIVVLGGISTRSNEPATVELRNITASNFEVRLVKWAYQEANPGEENLHYLAATPGIHELEGIQLLAGESVVSETFRTVELAEVFKGVPVVLATRVSARDQTPSCVRLRAVAEDRFSVRLQREESAEKALALSGERLHYMALTTGDGLIDGTSLRVGTTGDRVTHRPKHFSFGTTFAQTPLFLGAIQTNDGGDPVTLRYSDLNTESVELLVQEDQSWDEEQIHTTEVVGWVAIAAGEDVADGDCPTIDFEEFVPQSFGGAQDRGEFAVLNGGTELLVSENGWKAILLNYTVTEETIIEFDFKSTIPAEIHAIGFDNDNSLSAEQTIQVGGTQDWGHTQYSNYDGSGEWRTYQIPVGNFYTGSYNRLFFAADHDGGARNGNSFFRNVRLFEGSTCSSPSPLPKAAVEPLTIHTPQFELFPNPARTAVQLELSVAAATTAEVRIINMAGQIVYTESLPLEVGVQQQTLPLSSLAGGTYVLQVVFPDGQLSQRLTILP